LLFFSMQSIALLLASFGVLALAHNNFGGGPDRFGGRGGHHHGGPPLPPFMVNVTSQGRADFFRIFQDQNQTKGGIKTAIGAWANTYGVSAAVTAFEAEMKAATDERRANVSAAVAQLNEALTTLYAIEDDDSITPRQNMEQTFEAIDAMSEELRDLVLAVPPRPPMGPAGPGPRGPGPRGPGGFQGPRGQGGFQGPRGFGGMGGQGAGSATGRGTGGFQGSFEGQGGFGGSFPDGGSFYGEFGGKGNRGGF
ncbi:hypothetical protein PFISCL1PPCAC_13281, partial [Pristionchus fissidentatus]